MMDDITALSLGVVRDARTTMLVFNAAAFHIFWAYIYRSLSFFSWVGLAFFLGRFGFFLGRFGLVPGSSRCFPSDVSFFSILFFRLVLCFALSNHY